MTSAEDISPWEPRTRRRASLRKVANASLDYLLINRLERSQKRFDRKTNSIKNLSLLSREFDKAILNRDRFDRIHLCQELAKEASLTRIARRRRNSSDCSWFSAELSPPTSNSVAPPTNIVEEPPTVPSELHAPPSSPSEEGSIVTPIPTRRRLLPLPTTTQSGLLIR
eukprot:GHVU01065971.1.p1 GENE.GHVU01065971.1~~GHVU01065971.1.p1  ORF type:complete len:168 (-),score=9.89 GHVU01065971.1:453-956(-)